MAINSYTLRIHRRNSDANDYLAWRAGDFPEPLSKAELARQKAQFINNKTVASLKQLSRINADQAAAKNNQYLGTIKKRRKAFIAAATVKNLSREVMVAANVEPEVIEEVIKAQDREVGECQHSLTQCGRASLSQRLHPPSKSKIC